MPNGRRTKGRASRAPPVVRVQQPRSLVPPPQNVNPTIRATQRYICSHNNFLEYLIYPEDLGCYRGVAKSSTVLHSNMQSVRLLGIECWQPYVETDPSTYVDQTCYIDWNVPNVANQFYDFDPTSQVTGTTASIAQPAYLRAKPPPRSAAGRWCDLTNTSAHPALCRLGVGNGCIIDVTFEYHLGAMGPAAYNSWPATGFLLLTPDASYSCCLDHFTGTKHLLPVGPTIEAQ